VTFGATAAAGAAADLAIETAAAGAKTGSAFTTQPRIRLVDANGNVATGTTAMVTASIAGQTMVGTATVTATGVGVFTTVGTLALIGDYTITYSATLGGVTKTVTQPISVSLGNPAKYVVTRNGGSTMPVTTAVLVTAQLTDVAGQPVAQAGVTASFTRGGGGFYEGGNGSDPNITTSTNASGIATRNFFPDPSPGRTVTLSVGGGGMTQGSAPSFLTVPGPAVVAAFSTQPGSGARDAVISPAVVVQLRDSKGNQATEGNYAVTLSLFNNPGGATLSGNEATSSNGGASFPNLRLSATGTGYTLRAQFMRADGSTATSVASTAFNIDAVAAIVSVNGGFPGFAIRDETVYFIHDSDVEFTWRGSARMSSSSIYGGPTTQLSTITTPVWLGRVRVTADALYWFVGNGTATDGRVATTDVYRMPWATGVAAKIGSVPGGSAYGEVHDGYAYGMSLKTSEGSNPVPRVWRMDAAGTVEYLETFDACSPAECTRPAAFTVRDGTIYYYDIEDGFIKKMPVAGGAPVVVSLSAVVMEGQQTPDQMIAIGSSLYFIADQKLQSVPLNGAAVPTVHGTLTGSVHNTGSMVTDGTFLYFSDGGALVKYNLTGFARTIVVAGTSVTNVYVNATHLYWTLKGAGLEGLGASLRKMVK
jgi:hypothetical protein